MKKMHKIIMACLILLLMSVTGVMAGGGCLEMRNGYFWDPVEQEYFIPHGVAYQLWNPPVYAVQTLSQFAYDMAEMKRMHVNSLRVEMTWSQIETNEGAYDFTKADYLVDQAEEKGLKLFLLMGYQYPPDWLKNQYPERMAYHYDQYISETGMSDILNYNCPAAKASYASYVSNMCARYKDRDCIGGWIVGNEFAYFDLWEPPDDYPSHRYVGFDTNYSLPSYQQFLDDRYEGNIATLNSAYGTAYSTFSEIPMPTRYPTNRMDPLSVQQSGYNDVLYWRQQTIAEFVSAGVGAAKAGDTNHLVTYAMVGGIFSGLDDNYTCEDAMAIVEQCEADGNPVDFWTINNYPWTWTGCELRSMDYGIAKYRDRLGVPVMVSECGLTDTDTIFVETAYRQAGALASLPWEAIMSGAIGAHIFHWNDRNEFFTYDNVLRREGGFGMLHDSRLIKDVYWNVLSAYRKMDEIHIERLFPGSQDPNPDIAVYWSKTTDLLHCRLNQELAMIWTAFMRSGFQLGIIDEDDFDAGAYTNMQAVFLPRNMMMQPERLDALESNVLANGVSVHANADLPGQFDVYFRSNANWQTKMSSIFGLDVTAAVPGYESGITFSGEHDDYEQFEITVVTNTGLLNTNFSTRSWKIWHGLTNASGVVLATHQGVTNTQPDMPALQVKDHGGAYAAINTMAIGDNYPTGQDSPRWEHAWDVRTYFLDAIYRETFGIEPVIELSSNGEIDARYVTTDYRVCSNGSCLISIMNMSHIDHSVSNLIITAPTLFNGRKIENLTDGGVLTNNAGDSLTIPATGDKFILLYAYNTDGTNDESLVNTSAGKVWFMNGPDTAPTRVYGKPNWEVVHVGYDIPASLDWENLMVGFEQVSPEQKRYGLSATNWLAPGTGSTWIAFPVPDADLGDSDYLSSSEGGEYVLAAWLEDMGEVHSRTEVPVELFWGVKPDELPESIEPNTAYDITIEWEDIPSYASSESPTPLNRADQWPLSDTDDLTETYQVQLDLVRDFTNVLCSTSIVTSAGTGSNTFHVVTPADANTNDQWRVTLVSLDVSDDFVDSFEDRIPGNNSATYTNDAPLIVWLWGSPAQGMPGGWEWYDQGIGINPVTHGEQSEFLIIRAASGWSGNTYRFDLGHNRDVSDASVRSGAVVSVDVCLQDTNGLGTVDGRLELEVEDESGSKGVGYFSYTNNGFFQTLSVSLDQFGPAIDWSKLRYININVVHETPSAVYCTFLDNVRLTGVPPIAGTGGATNGVYWSYNDTQADPETDTDGDGLPDAYEDDTGVYVDPEHTGTDPNNPDTDGDGHTDGEEVLITGTDPCSASDAFVCESEVGGSVNEPLVLSWYARTNRTYCIQFCDGPLSNSVSFNMLDPYTNITVQSDGMTNVVDSTTSGVSRRYYRIRVTRE